MWHSQLRVYIPFGSGNINSAGNVTSYTQSETWITHNINVLPIIVGHHPETNLFFLINEFYIWSVDPTINRPISLSYIVHLHKCHSNQVRELNLPTNNNFSIFSIYINSDLDLWPIEPKISRLLPIPYFFHLYKLNQFQVTIRKPFCSVFHFQLQ